MSVLNVGNQSGCNRCGKCCHYWFEGKLKKCKFLQINKNTGTTYCKTFTDRIGKKLDTGIICTYNNATFFDHEDCPLNLGRIMYPKTWEEFNFYIRAKRKRDEEVKKLRERK